MTNTAQEKAVRRHAERLGLALHKSRRAISEPWTFESPDPDARWHEVKLWSIHFPSLTTADEFLDQVDAEATE